MACLKKTKYDNNDYFDILLTWMGLDENLNVDQKIGILKRNAYQDLGIRKVRLCELGGREHGETA